VPEIFLVEDSAVLRRIYTEILRGAGHNVTALENGALSKDHEFVDRADLLLTDLEMPDVDGFEVIKNVRASHPDLPILVVTGLPLESTQDLPCNQVFEKPLDEQKLIDAIEELLAM